ncbi:small secreted hydrophilic protein [Streptomyces sp. JB150]|uniref:small secreted hydrophilic protein n=1 Tax=Streptomyces sp. JB150 TaxID=2714844 RepID=UPI00140D48A4|nr:small secreted hydrophilic protein [Streptomyces sp. JB150]QIJ62886.1 small secreted hydrophilic protein [Streptomyces sp. JB150]
MVFTRRLAVLAAAVVIPLGIAATSSALTDSPEPPKVPARVELDSGSPSPPSRTAPSATPAPVPAPSDRVVPRPPVTDAPGGDDDDDDRGAGDDDGPGDDG